MNDIGKFFSLNVNRNFIFFLFFQYKYSPVSLSNLQYFQFSSGFFQLYSIFLCFLSLILSFFSIFFNFYKFSFNILVSLSNRQCLSIFSNFFQFSKFPSDFSSSIEFRLLFFSFLSPLVAFNKKNIKNNNKFSFKKIFKFCIR